MTTPETIRAAAYLATRERMDLRGKGPKCNPPNRVCGDRCIPPNWKCRVKGEGTDGHSRAVAGDPLAGAASIARGQKRFFRGFKTGDLTEIQAGRAAISRGIVKAVPGQNLKQKQKLRKAVEKGLLPVATAAFTIWALQRGHEGAKLLFPAYRNGPARDIERFANGAISSVLDAVPVYGRLRQNKRQAGGVAAQVVARASRRSVLADPGSSDLDQRAILSEIGTQKVAGLKDALATGLSARDNGQVLSYQQYRSRLLTSVLGANTEGKRVTYELNPNTYEWKRTERSAPKSVYAETAAVNYMASMYGLSPSLMKRGDGTASGPAAISRVTQVLRRTRESMIADMEVRGLNRRNPDDIERYLQLTEKSAARRLTAMADDQRQSALDNYRNTVRELLTPPAKGPDVGLSAAAVARRQYESAETAFSDYFLDSAKRVSQDTNPINQVPAAASAGSPVRTTLLGVTDRVKDRAGLANATIRGANHAELVLQKLYHEYALPSPQSRKNTTSTWTASDFDIRAAAQDMGWNGEGGTLGAYEVVRKQFPRLAAPPSAPPPPAPRPTPAPTGRTRRAGRVSDSQRISNMLRQKNKDGTPRYATREAAEAALRSMRNRGDALPARVEAYLAYRSDFKESARLGKPCGASHIPKAHECRKNAPENASSSGPDRKRQATIVAGVVGGALAISVAGSVAYNFKNLQDPSKTYLKSSPDIKELVKTMKKDAGVKSASEAMGHYYTQRSGLKPGDVVYMRHDKDPAGHFGVYLGEGNDGIVRAVIANTKTSRFSWADVVEIGSTKPGVKAAQAVMTPLVKAPRPSFADTRGQNFSSEEVVRRAIRIAGTDYKFSITKDNCEALANGIAYGVPESEQLKRFRRATRVVADVAVGRAQRSEGRRAIYEGRAQGRSYSATEFVKFLEGNRQFSSYVGRDLAKQYAQYFQNSRVDAPEGETNGLISPDELWKRIGDYGPAMRAQAMADYLLILRTLPEIDAEPDGAA